MRANQHVVEVHADDDLMQDPCGVHAQSALGFGAMALGRIGTVGFDCGVQGGDQADTGFEEPLIQ
ncbi:Uncharacterised protein [Mycobacterium tuberculosis]|nr:Uncharacterised protein [Mycobacterium tuberculosis]